MKSFLEFFRSMNESDTSARFQDEIDLSNHLKKHGLMRRDTKPAGPTGGNDFHIEHPTTGKKVRGKVIPSVRAEGELKKSVSAGKFGSVAVGYHPEKGWYIPEKTQKNKPEFTKQVHAATVTSGDGPNRVTRSLLDHLNHHWGPPRKDVHLPGVTSDTTDMSPAHAYMRDHNVHVIHIGDRGTFRAGHSETKDPHNTGLPTLSGTGRFSVSNERAPRPGGLPNKQINFKPLPKSVENSHTDISTDKGAKQLKSNMRKKKK